MAGRTVAASYIAAAAVADGEQRELWRRAVIRATLPDMDITNLQTGDTPRPETEVDRRRRIAREAALIAEADADVAAGRLVSSVEAKAWIDSIDTDRELPVPYSRR